MGFEKYECNKPSNGKIDYLFCNIERLNRDHLKVEFQVNLSEPVDDAWLHVVSYQKAKTYQRFAFDMWGNICEYLDGKTKSFAMDWLIGTIRQYTNLNHSCPVDGVVTTKIKNISVNQFLLESIIPIGRYRLDIDVMEKRKDLLFSQKIFFNITEQRNERRYG